MEVSCEGNESLGACSGAEDQEKAQGITSTWAEVHLPHSLVNKT